MADPDPAVLMVMESVFPSEGGGGAEHQVRTLALELIRRGVSVTVLVPRVAGGPRAERDQVEGIPVRRLAYPPQRLVGALWLHLALIGWLIRERHRYDVIHAHIAGNLAGVCCLLGRLLGKPVVVKPTGMYELRVGVLSDRHTPANRLRAWALRRASAFQAISDRIARRLEARGFARERVRRIPNAVDVARFDAGVPDPRIAALRGEASIVGVYVGRLEAEKGVALLLEGWARALRERADVQLWVIGEGSMREALEACCRTLGIAGRIRFIGGIERIEDYLRLADFGVLCSLHEGLSNTLLEYMAAGLPVLGTAVSGTEDFVVDGHTGWLVPPGDAAAIGVALAEVVAASPAARRERGAAARARVLEHASIGAVVDRLMQTYIEAGARPASACAQRGGR